MFSSNKKFLFFSLFLIVNLLISCATSNDVVSNKLFQKRKYKKGWHKNTSPNYNTKSKKEKDTFVTSNEVVKLDEIEEEEIREAQKLEKNQTLSFNQTKSESEHSEPITATKSKKTPSSTPQVRNVIEDISQINANDSHSASVEKIESPPLDRSNPDTRIILAILGVIVLIFTGISPLAVWIALGRGEVLRINSIIYLIAILMTILLLFAIILTLAAASYELIAIVVGLVTIALYLGAFTHAIVSIIRGY